MRGEQYREMTMDRGKGREGGERVRDRERQ